jgi:hypothetical protein
MRRAAGHIANGVLTVCRDWKKLTFYYFADAYINFNSLVTDLFKIYKTRIWMSAINPASFASPALGLQAPSGIGPGAVGVGRGQSGNTERRQPQPQETQQPASYTPTGQGGRGFQSSFNQNFSPERPVVPASGYPQPNYPYSSYPGFGGAQRPSNNMPYAPGMLPSMDSYPSGFTQPGEFGPGRNRFPNGPAGAAPHDQAISPINAQGDWVGSFQGLSLNTR